MSALPVFVLSAALLTGGAPAPEPEAPLPDAARPEEGLLFGAQPSAEQLRALAAAGYLVIDLRRTEEDRGFDEPALARDLGLDHRTFPTSARELADPSHYPPLFELLDSTRRPLAIHCASGNRVGALWYAYLVARRGLPRDEAERQARAHGLRSDALRDAVDRALDAGLR